MIGLLSALALSEPIDAHLMYFVLVDRFYNADTQNDPSPDLKDPQAFHGGDLDGLRQKLPYLKSLGVDVVWLSPIFHMRKEKFEGHGAFHGYWVQDLYEIEPAFGGEEALLSLGRTAKSEGIDLVMDMVYNHVSFDSPMRIEKKHWFHEEKPIVDWNDPYELTHHQVHGLPDLDQSNEEVYTYLKEQTLYWKEKAQLRGFRIDAIRHMEDSFLARLSNDIKDSQSWLLGEDFQGNPVALIERARASKLDALFDFPNYYAMTDLFCRQGSVGAFAANLWLDQYFPEGFQHVTFLDNHDLPRLHSSCDESNAFQALFTQLSIRGLPMVTYGTELKLKGEHEPENRADMPWDSIDDPRTEMIARMTQLRRQHPVLEHGLGLVESLAKDHMVYTQFLDGEAATLVINRGEEAIEFPHSPTECFMVTDRFQPCSGSAIPKKSARLWIEKRITPQRTKKRKDIIVSPCRSDQDLRLVGSSSELGGWNPDKGLQLIESNGTCRATLLLDQYSVLRFKVVEYKDNEVKWEKGSDHILWNQPLLQIPWQD